MTQPASPPPSAWGPPPPPQPYAGWPPQLPLGDPTAAEALRKARTALGWAIGAAVGAGLALLGMVVALVVAGVGAADAYSSETVRGEVVGLAEGSALSGDRLERALADGLRDLGVEEADIACPDTASVAVSTVVVCTGEVEGYEWTGVVVFEDSAGAFAVVEL